MIHSDPRPEAAEFSWYCDLFDNAKYSFVTCTYISGHLLFPWRKFTEFGFGFQFLGMTSHLPLSLLMSMRASKISQNTFFIDAISAVYDMTLVWYVWRVSGSHAKHEFWYWCKATWHGLQNVPYVSDLCFPSRARGLTIRELCVHCLLYLCVGTRWAAHLLECWLLNGIYQFSSHCLYIGSFSHRACKEQLCYRYFLC